ncbi:MAG TPA: SIMPL domain-containing protein [Solirubrobacterales bacterium]|nr:SIMPL domain-containing protein [Solirubrobacterales bacterium]
MNPRSLTAIATVMLVLLLPSTAAAAERTVSVHGTSTLKVPNDTASLGFSVSKERKTRKAAIEAVAVDLRKVIATVQGTPGVSPSDISTGEISVRKTTKGKRTLYRAAEGIGVILHEPNRAGELVNAAIAAGATGTRGPNFFAGNPEAAFNNALLAAFAQAKAKATALASSAGATLGQVLSIEEGTEVSETPFSADAKGAPEASPSPPVKPGNSTVTATVRVVFALL